QDAGAVPREGGGVEGAAAEDPRGAVRRRADRAGDRGRHHASGARTGRAVLALTLLAACSAGTRSPEGAVRALAEAAADGDRATAFQLLGPQTRARLESDARRAGEQTGGRALKAEELLAVGWFPPRFRAEDVREKERSGD